MGPYDVFYDDVLVTKVFVDDQRDGGKSPWLALVVLIDKVIVDDVRHGKRDGGGGWGGGERKSVHRFDLVVYFCSQ